MSNQAKRHIGKYILVRAVQATGMTLSWL